MYLCKKLNRDATEVIEHLIMDRSYWDSMRLDFDWFGKCSTGCEPELRAKWERIYNANYISSMYWTIFKEHSAVNVAATFNVVVALGGRFTSTSSTYYGALFTSICARMSDTYAVRHLMRNSDEYPLNQLRIDIMGSNEEYVTLVSTSPVREAVRVGNLEIARMIISKPKIGYKCSGYRWDNEDAKFISRTNDLHLIHLMEMRKREDDNGAWR